MLNMTKPQVPRFTAPDPDLRGKFLYPIFPLLYMLALCILFFIPNEFKYSALLTTTPIFGLIAGCSGPLLQYFMIAGSSKARDVKRQQAAASNARFVPSWTMNSYPLPSYFTVHMQRSLRATYLVGAIGSLIPIGFFMTFFRHWQNDIDRALQISQSLHWGLLGIAIDISFLVWMSYGLITLIVQTTRQQLIITESCLIFIAGNGKATIIPWHEAQLYAIIAGTANENATVVYELSSPTAIIRWLSRPTGKRFGMYSYYPIMGVKPFGMAQPYPSEEAYMHQISMLNYIITARTRLYLHDLR